MDMYDRAIGFGFDFAAGLGKGESSGSAVAYADPGVLALAAGSAGLDSPGHASSLAIETLRTFTPKDADSDPLDSIKGVMRQIVRSLRIKVEADSAWKATLTSLTAIFCGETRMAIAHVGKTRAYVFRDGNLNLLTRDHTIERIMLDAGRSPEEVSANPDRYALTRYLDGHRDVEFDFSLYDMRIGDRILLCSYSVWKTLPDSSIQHAIRARGGAADAVQNVLARFPSHGYLYDAICVVGDIITLPHGDGPSQSPITIRS
jgi:serine/threonine protein phosphatase PrpC